MKKRTQVAPRWTAAGPSCMGSNPTEDTIELQDLARSNNLKSKLSKNFPDSVATVEGDDFPAVLVLEID